MNLLSLLGGGDLAGADGPDWLVGNNNLGPVFDRVGDGLQLRRHVRDGLPGLALREGLATTQDDAEAAVEGRLCLVGNKLSRWVSR